MRQFKPKLTYSNVISTLCLFLILGGGAYAMSSAPKNSVTSRSIKNGAVKRADLAANSVNGSKVADRSLTAADLGGPVAEAAHSANADQAGSAANAEKLDGLDSTAFYPNANARSFVFTAPDCTDATDPGCSADFSLDGLSLTATCFVNGGTNPELDIENTSTTDALGWGYVVYTGQAAWNSTQPGGTFPVVAPSGDKVVQGTMINITNAGETANFAADAYNSSVGTGAGCDLWLFALRSG